jgi:hypothetical protein
MNTFSVTLTVFPCPIPYNFDMEKKILRRIPKWKVNARTQVHNLAKDNLMNFRDLPSEWNELSFNIGPITAEIRFIDDETSLLFRCMIGEVSDTYGVAEIYEELPLQGLNLEYELKPQSRVHASLQMSLSEVTSATEIYRFIRDCSLLSVVGLQTLIHLGNLISPNPSEIEQFQLGPGQANWENPGIASELLRR